MSNTIGHYAVHPDSLPVDAAPDTEKYYCDVDVWHHSDFAEKLERRARAAETKVAELQRELAWLRRGLKINATYAEPYIKHLASLPPDDWKDSNA